MNISNMLRSIYTIAVCVLIISCTTDNTSKIDSYFGIDIPKDSLNGYLESRMKELNIPGLSIAIINNGQVVYHKTSGYADLEKQLPMTDKTIFEGASMSKSVFAFFVMTYVEDGKLNLDRPLYEYLPYPDIAYDERYKKITARMVLSHRSGLPNWRENEEDKKLRIKFEPGTEYLYSGEGYQYLAMVLKKIEGTDWKGLEAKFQERIGKPLGMEHTVFIQTPYTREFKAEPYDKNGIWIDWKKDYWYQKGNGIFGAGYSIHSEPLDFSKWMIGVMNKQLLSEKSYGEMFEHRSNIPDAEMDISYTLGFFALPFPFGNTYGHGGDNDGFTGYYTLNTEKNWGFVLFTNSEYGQQLGEELFEYLILGPDLTIPYTVGIMVLLLILSGILFGIRYVIRKFMAKRRMNATTMSQP